MIICVVGQPLSGKDTVAKYLKERKSFNNVSTGDIIREEMRKNKISLDRDNMQLFAEKSRKQYGNQYPANIAIERIINNGANKIVVSGPRNMAEINAFREKFGNRFVLVAIDASIEIRYERAKSRGREGDDISFEQFKEEENLERAGNSGSHELDDVLKSADYVILNDASEEELFGKIDSLLKSIS